MGFIPNTLYDLVKKPNILGAYALLSANIKGFSGSKVSPFIGHVASNAAGCRYCQAHTANSAYKHGVSIEKLQKVWEFQTSDLFSEKEKAALEFALAAGSIPNRVTPIHHKELQRHFSDKQIVEIVAVIAMYGFLNRWNDSMATQLENKPANFAKQHLSKTWKIGKNE